MNSQAIALPQVQGIHFSTSNQSYSKAWQHQEENAQVNPVDDLQMPRQKLFDEIKLPPLKSLRQDSVATSYQHSPKPVTEKSSLSVGKHFLGNLPGSVVVQLFFIDQDSHQLRDSKCWMSVVHLDTDVVGELGPRKVKLAKTTEHVLERRANPNCK